MPKYKDDFDNDELNYEMEELENDYGMDVSQITKVMGSKPKKNHKNIKFHKDGFYDKNRK